MNFFGLQPLSDEFASQQHPSVAKAGSFKVWQSARLKPYPFKAAPLGN
jgi:hypothetical protein